jgi:chemotaxis-related protein WspB
MLSLLFSLGDSLYAIPARSVVEVVPHVALRILPGAPPWVPGMLAYRGRVLPVVDLGRKLFGAASGESRLSSRIVVVETKPERGGRRFGILTERVSEVRRISLENSTSAELDRDGHVAAIVLERGVMIQLLEIDAVLPVELALQAAAEA